MSDSKKIDTQQSCSYCSLEFTEQYDIDYHIANGECKVKQPTDYEKELLQRVMDQEVLIQAMNRAIKNIVKEAIKNALESQPNQTTNYNLNIICLDQPQNQFGTPSLSDLSDAKLDTLTYVEANASTHS